MDAHCNRTKLTFHPHNRREVAFDFDGGAITSDAGALLLREVEQRLGILARFAECFEDHRDQRFVEHSLCHLICQRVMGICLGYEDVNDHDELRSDPLLALCAGKGDIEGKSRRRPADRGMALAGKSTLNRIELACPDTAAEDRYKKISLRDEAAADFFVERFLEAHQRAPGRIVLDLDATDDPLHGEQEGRFFHGYYKCYCYLPLYIFSGRHLLCAKLRGSDVDGAAGAVEELERIVGLIRQAWPEVEIVVRGDSGFCREALIAWCEQSQGVHYVLGLARNSRLIEMIADELEEARAGYEATGAAHRVFKDMQYRTLKSWSRSRRVAAKAEHLAKGANPRFVVTSLPASEYDARALYEDVYCARGEMENRIKEQQLCLFADRTSAATMRANQIRLWLSSAAYVLMEALRRVGLTGSRMADSQCDTIRLKLLKIGARVKVSLRRVWVSAAEGCAHKEAFGRAHENLRRLRPWHERPPPAAPMRC